jgi:hypothetical protein
MNNPGSWYPKPTNPKEKAEQLFGHCFEVTRFEEGDKIPVGGESIFSTETDIKITGDFENFKDFFEQVNEMASKYDLPKLKEWLASQEIEIDEKIFAKLLAFTKKFEQQYPHNSEGGQTRKKLYTEQGTELKLSDIFRVNSAECAEISALAQDYLQNAGISSTYFSGDVLWDRDSEFSEEHSFIVIRQGKKIYLYDPTNPLGTNQGTFPSIYTTEANFDEEMRKNKKRFITARNILSKKEAFYGVNDGTNVDAERHIV